MNTTLYGMVQLFTLAYASYCFRHISGIGVQFAITAESILDLNENYSSDSFVVYFIGNVLATGTCFGFFIAHYMANLIAF